MYFKKKKKIYNYIFARSPLTVDWVGRPPGNPPISKVAKCHAIANYLITRVPIIDNGYLYFANLSPHSKTTAVVQTPLPPPPARLAT